MSLEQRRDRLDRRATIPVPQPHADILDVGNRGALTAMSAATGHDRA